MNAKNIVGILGTAYTSAPSARGGRYGQGWDRRLPIQSVRFKLSGKWGGRVV